MNKLISILQAENNLSIARLKQLYRMLSKKTHPDLSQGSASAFLGLQREYEEALAILKEKKTAAATPGNHGPLDEKSSRKAVMQFLYVYALKFYGSEAETVLLKLIRALGTYSPGVQRLLRSYYNVFYKTFAAWHRQGRIYYTHNLFIAAVKQLFYYYSLDIPLHKRLLFVYFDELKKRSLGLAGEQQKILLDLEQWLKEEADKEKIKVV